MVNSELLKPLLHRVKFRVSPHHNNAQGKRNCLKKRGWITEAFMQPIDEEKVIPGVQHGVAAGLQTNKKGDKLSSTKLNLLKSVDVTISND